MAYTTMSTQALRPVSSAAPKTLCRACLIRSITANRQQRRPIHLSTLAKRKEADDYWAARAERIKQGEEPNLWDIFKERGYVKDIAGYDPASPLLSSPLSSLLSLFFSY